MHGLKISLNLLGLLVYLYLDLNFENFLKLLLVILDQKKDSQ